MSVFTQYIWKQDKNQAFIVLAVGGFSNMFTTRCLNQIRERSVKMGATVGGRNRGATKHA